MRRQQGQSAVEFALMAPMIFLMIFGLIYSGIMFMEYMHYSNAVRKAARVVALDKTTREQEQAWLREIWKEEVSVTLYEPDPKIIADNGDIVVTVTFVRVGSLPVILHMLDFPPSEIKALNYRMKAEDSTIITTGTEGDDG